MTALPVTKAIEDYHVNLPQTDDDGINTKFRRKKCSTSAEKSYDIAGSEDKQSKLVIEKQKEVEKELHVKNIQFEEPDDGKGPTDIP